MPKIFGLIEFSEPLYCAPDSLGQSVAIKIAGYKGTLTLPSLPEWSKDKTDPLHMPLIAPPPAKTWKGGGELLTWGRPFSYPSGHSEVYLALIEFFEELENAEAIAQKIYQASEQWLELFEAYKTLYTKQHTRSRIFVIGGSNRIELLLEVDSEIKELPYNITPIIKVTMPNDDILLHLGQLQKAAELASQNLQPDLQYRMLLEAYHGLKNEDYRKAIIVSTIALEICFAERTRKELNRLKFPSVNELMKKFRGLGGLLELLKLMEISPMREQYNDIKDLIIEPRNKVIHLAEPANEALANQVIREVEKLLRILSPM